MSESKEGSEQSQSEESVLRGPVRDQGFLNFMRCFALQFSEGNIPSVIRSGKVWDRMSEEQKNDFRTSSMNLLGLFDDDDWDIDSNPEQACCPKKRKRKSACCPPKKKRRRCAPKKPACPPTPTPCCPVRKRRKSSCRPKPKCKPKPRCRPKPKCPAKRKPRCCPKPKKRCRRMKCSKPGPITNNGYLNFLRAYRRKHCGLKPKDLIMKAARAWCRLPEEKKNKYRRQACKVTTSCRHKRRKVCQ